MCGIVGYVGHQDAWPIVLAGLQRLEYRGYDSAGIAILTPSGELEIQKSAGKVKELTTTYKDTFPHGQLGLGHTRWATHGRPTDANAHPHTDCHDQVAVVHNGIVENYLDLKKGLLSRGHTFSSETDSEAIAHLIEEGLQDGLTLEEAFVRISSLLQGAQAILATTRGATSKKLVALRLGNAGGIVVAQRPGEAMLSSDLPAVVTFGDRVTFLDDGELAIVTEEEVKCLGPGGQDIAKVPQLISQSGGWVDKEGYKHFMLKEIAEQPRVVANALVGRVDFESGEVTLEDFPLGEREVRELQRVVLIGCGTSLHAAMVGKYFMEDVAGITAEVDSGSEFRYRNFQADGRSLVISIGQSGETADTLAAMAAVREKGGRLITLCNVEGSQATRMAESTLYMRTGPEVGVASTKTFIASLALLSIVSIHLGRIRGVIDPQRSQSMVNELARLPHLVGKVLADHRPYERLARQFYKYEHFLFLGRGITYPIALEGALKLKEISYIHAEGYSAGEMKHGPIALIDPNMPVVAIAPDGPLYGKMLSNIKEVKARDGLVLAVATEGDEEIASHVNEVLYVPRCSELLIPLLSLIPLQLFAYYIAVRRGCDVDQPRNLAKSVTVE